MSRFLARRLALIPVVLVLVNVSGYAHTHLVLPMRAVRIPCLLPLPDPSLPLLSYLDYLQNALQLNLCTQTAGKRISRSSSWMSVRPAPGCWPWR